ncbi:MAG: hypothetical protein E6Q97_20505 [Desulfurellales bacterium]|nr:MAG: hypothetical protein E6Q97_20505 [Desulfurellales bacterium]
MYRKQVTLTLPNGSKLPITVAIARQDGDWMVAAEFTVGGHPVRVCATASEAAVRAAMGKLGARTTTGGWFDDLGNRIAKFARSKALTQALASVATFAKNPLFAKLAGYYPPLQMALKYVGKGAEAAVAAQNLIARAKGGDAKASQSISKIATLAKGGNKQATMLFNVLHTVKKTTEEQKPSSLFDFGDLISSSGPPERDEDLEKLVRTVRAT